MCLVIPYLAEKEMKKGEVAETNEDGNEGSSPSHVVPIIVALGDVHVS